MRRDPLGIPSSRAQICDDNLPGGVIGGKSQIDPESHNSHTTSTSAIENIRFPAKYSLSCETRGGREGLKSTSPVYHADLSILHTKLRDEKSPSKLEGFSQPQFDLSLKNLKIC